MQEEAKPVSKPGKYPVNSVFTINDARVIYAEAGTSLLALAASYNVSFARILEFNDLASDEILNSNQLIFLQKKQKRGSREIHIVEENETLHDIAQKEGVQLTSIMELNGLQKNMQPARGEKIYLKNAAPAAPRLASANGMRVVSSM